MAQFFALLLAIAKAVPVVDKWIQSFVAFYVGRRIDAMDAAIVGGIKKAITDKDQRDLEKAIGNPDAGEPTNYPGTIISPTRPGA